MKHLFLYLLLLASCAVVADTDKPDIFIGSYTETLYAREAGADTLFFIREESYTSVETYAITSDEAHAWAERFGYVIEW